MSNALGAFTIVFQIAYFLLGIVQLFATVDGIGVFLGVHGFFAWVIAMFLAWFPFVGTITGIYGAIEAWHWETWQAFTLFIGPLVAIYIFAILWTAVDRLRGNAT
jgi:hypothetical protein